MTRYVLFIIGIFTLVIFFTGCETDDNDSNNNENSTSNSSINNQVNTNSNSANANTGNAANNSTANTNTNTGNAANNSAANANTGNAANNSTANTNTNTGNTANNSTANANTGNAANNSVDFSSNPDLSTGEVDSGPEFSLSWGAAKALVHCKSILAEDAQLETCNGKAGPDGLYEDGKFWSVNIVSPSDSVNYCVCAVNSNNAEEPCTVHGLDQWAGSWTLYNTDHFTDWKVNSTDIPDIVDFEFVKFQVNLFNGRAAKEHEYVPAPEDFNDNLPFIYVNGKNEAGDKIYVYINGSTGEIVEQRIIDASDL